MLRSEELKAAGLVVLELGDQAFTLRVLRIKEQREWQRGAGQAVTAIGTFDVKTPGDGIEVIKRTLLLLGVDQQIDIISAYDVDHVLESREWIEENATSEQVYAALREVATVAFPFMRDAESLLAAIGPLISAALSEQASSTSSPSPTGVSTPRVLKSGSRMSSSTSSGKRARSA